MIGLFVLTSIVPGLATPRFEAAWTAYWKRGVARRLVPLLLVGIMGAGAAPARAQAAVYDPMAWFQRGAEFLKTEWRYLEQKYVDKPTDLLREAALAYRAYKQSRALYQRVAGGSVSLSLVKALPYIDIGTDLGNGQSETITIRPVFRAQDRIRMFQGKRFRVEPFNMNNLDFDVDRNVVGNVDPNAGKDDATLQQEASSDGWQSWKMIQSQQGLKEDDQAILDGPTYQIYNKLEPFYQKRAANLSDIAQKTLDLYGEDSVQYEQAIQALADWNRAVVANQTAEAKAIEARMKVFDDAAKTEIEKYATHAYELSATNARAYQGRKNQQEISFRYDSDPRNQGLSLADFILIDRYISEIGNTLGAMGGAPIDKTKPGIESSEPMGQGQKTVALLSQQTENGSQALKLQNRKAMEESQAKMKEIATAKAQELKDIFDERNARIMGDEAAKARLLLKAQTRGLELQNAATLLPDGVTLIVSERDQALVPGAAGPNQAAQVMARNLENVAKVAAAGMESDVTDALVDTGKRVSWGFMRPVMRSLDAAYKAFTGTTMGLSDWTERKLNAA